MSAPDGRPSAELPRRARVGREGEEAAAARYLGAGYQELARNWRCAMGEIDLVVARGGVVVFCEVKTRADDRFGGGYAAVTPRKRRRLRRLAEAFLADHRMVPAGVRFDVASVRRRPDGTADVHVFEDAF